MAWLRIDLETGLSAPGLSEGKFENRLEVVKFAKVYRIDTNPKTGREKKPVLLAGPLGVNGGKGSFSDILTAIGKTVDRMATELEDKVAS